MAKKVQHGGKRKGEGRPPKEDGKTVVIAASVPEDVATALRAFAKSQDWSVSRVVTEALRGLLKRKGGAKRRGGDSNPTAQAVPIAAYKAATPPGRGCSPNEESTRGGPRAKQLRLQ